MRQSSTYSSTVRAAMSQYSLKTKLSHIKIQFHYVKDLIRDEKVNFFKYCPTEDMVADLFTKALLASQFERLTGILYNQL